MVSVRLSQQRRESGLNSRPSASGPEEGDPRMKKRSLINWLCILLAALFLQACAYSHVQRPLDTDYDSTSLGSKVGRAHIQSVLWLFAWGDAGSKAAADQGGITVIKHADTESTVILFGLYSKITTVVYGD